MASSASQAKRIVERKDLADRLSFVVKRKIKLFFVDEAQLMSKEQRSLGWQEPIKSNNFAKPVEAAAGITLVVVFSVKGPVTYALFVGSRNSAKYLSFLQKLKNLAGQERIGLFYDGSSVHKSAVAQKVIE